jgi:hypothetical protein
MKVDITPDGAIHVDSNGSTPGEIAAFTLSVQRELRQQQAEAEAAKVNGDLQRPVSLNDLQGETYDWLVAHDVEQGVHLSAVAAAFMLTKEAASHRLQTLADMGFARRVGTGKYRAVTE